MIQQLYDWLLAEVAAALGCNVVKGFPRWARPDQVPPIAALLITAWGPIAPKRIGQRETKQMLGLTLFTFARNEVELTQHLDALATWFVANYHATVNGEGVDVSFTDGVRHPNENQVTQEEHGFSVTVTLIW